MSGITIGKLFHSEEHAAHAQRAAHDQEGPCACQMPIFQGTGEVTPLTEPGRPDMLFPLLALGFWVRQFGRRETLNKDNQCKKIFFGNFAIHK